MIRGALRGLTCRTASLQKPFLHEGSRYFICLYDGKDPNQHRAALTLRKKQGRCVTSIVCISIDIDAQHDGIASARVERKGCLAIYMHATIKTILAQEHDRSYCAALQAFDQHRLKSVKTAAYK